MVADERLGEPVGGGAEAVVVAMDGETVIVPARVAAIIRLVVDYADDLGRMRAGCLEVHCSAGGQVEGKVSFSLPPKRRTKAEILTLSEHIGPKTT